MQLTELAVTRADAVVRLVKFKQGLNLILDKPTSGPKGTGNSVGKTTVLRLIDYCLGSEGNDIWQDAEFETNVNQEVYDFLHARVPVSIKLTLADKARGVHSLSRTFAPSETGKESLKIDDTAYPQAKSYRNAVKQLLFGSSGEKPSLRQLIPKFVRSSPLMMSRTLKYLGNYATAADYEALHLFLFGFFTANVLEERLTLMNSKKRLDRDWEALNRIRKEGEIEQLLIHLRREVEEIGLSPALKGEVPEIATRASVVSGIRSNAANVAGRLSRFDSEIASLRLTIKELESEYSNLDRQAVEAVYREAQSYLPKLHHDWNDLTEFIQGLRGRKQRFLQSQIQVLEEQAKTTTGELKTLQKQERDEIGAMVRSPEFARALEIRTELQEKLKKLGSLEQDQNDRKSIRESIESAEQQLAETRRIIDQEKASLQERLSVFNKHFSRLSELLYGEQYLLFFNDTASGSITFQLTAVGANVGAGKKASQTAAFDLAYISFLSETGINFPRFVCHDGLEQIHGNQLLALLNEANQTDGQLILATLRDKLPAISAEFFKENTILELSDGDKLFHLK
ncbi:MAG TPA: DUF2326 domain-containing protein [Terracidiphilus sp.]|jgi:uncharacterized protein YydD (DUF2326 family)|nr:DUF2326 domain-containing protein [Terracidiphilus sp.]